MARFASGYPQRPVRTAVARPHHPVPDGGGCQRIVCIGSRHNGRQSPSAPFGDRTQRRAGHGVHRPPLELPRRGTSRFADLRRSQRAHPHSCERTPARRQRTAHHYRGRRGGRKRRFADHLGCPRAAALRPGGRGSRDFRRTGLPFPQRERRCARADHRHRHRHGAGLSRDSHADARRRAVSRRPGPRTASASSDSSSRSRSSPPAPKCASL